MSIVVCPLVKGPKNLALMSDIMRKSANATASGKMPNIFVAADESQTTYDELKVAAAGFRYRRQSHHCEVTWWGGRDPQLLAEVIKALQLQSFLEGRKRIECFVEERTVSTEGTSRERGGKEMREALELAGFQYEGSHRFWTKELESVDVLGWVPLHDGMPKLDPAVQYVVGQNETTAMYFEKNTELYKKDRDYYRRVEDGQGLTFAEHLQRYYDFVFSQPNVSVVNDWTSKV